jgi:hypothetical protein
MTLSLFLLLFLLSTVGVPLLMERSPAPRAAAGEATNSRSQRLSTNYAYVAGIVIGDRYAQAQTGLAGGADSATI